MQACKSIPRAANSEDKDVTFMSRCFDTFLGSLGTDNYRHLNCRQMGLRIRTRMPIVCLLMPTRSSAVRRTQRFGYIYVFRCTLVKWLLNLNIVQGHLFRESVIGKCGTTFEGI